MIQIISKPDSFFGKAQNKMEIKGELEESQIFLFLAFVSNSLYRFLLAFQFFSLSLYEKIWFVYFPLKFRAENQRMPNVWGLYFAGAAIYAKKET